MVAFLILEARSVLTLWLGNGFENSVILVQVLAIGYGVNVLGGAASQTGAGVGRPEFDMRSTLVLVILNPILSLVIGPKIRRSRCCRGYISFADYSSGVFISDVSPQVCGKLDRHGV